MTTFLTQLAIDLTCCSSLLRPYRGYDTTDTYNYPYFFWIGARIFAREKKETNRNYFKSMWKFNISTLSPAHDVRSDSLAPKRTEVMENSSREIDSSRVPGRVQEGETRCIV